jgi:RNA polymerase-associated protein LEO1
LKLPKFLAIESQPFDPEKYQYKEFLQSAIRWRYKESIQESNSRLIRWNNGTFSLLVGDEMFDVKTPDIHSRYQFLATQHAKEQAVKTQARFYYTKRDLTSLCLLLINLRILKHTRNGCLKSERLIKR